MLTVKVMSPGGGEEIHCGLSVFNVEAAKAEHARQEAMMIELASAQAAITERINQAVNDAIANALRPGGVLYTSRTRT
ncbi:hypothetical protein [Phytobacter sp. RSE-02]|uniref:hypothetical protein n=1 Tax=Phytobacter sp. RSE-02 TaxID=3229229 RepID=UPI00339D88A9